MSRPNCYKCIHRREVPGSAHSACANRDAEVTGHEHGKKKGWFMWPFNYDPVWLAECDAFQEKGEQTK